MTTTALDPNAADALFAAAVQHHRAGQADEAARLYDAVLARNPTHADAQHLRALIALARGDARDGVERLRRAAAVAPDRPVILNDLGAAIRLAAQAEPRRFKAAAAEAAPRFAAAVAQRPDYAEAWHNLGLAQRACDDFAAARASLERAVALRPDFVPSRLALGVVLRRLEDIQGAAACFREATRLDPSSAEAWSNLGYALGELKEFAESESALLRALQINPRLVEANLNLSVVRTTAGDVDGSIRALDAVIALEPGNFKAASAKLFIGQSDPRRSGEDLLAQSRAWAGLVAAAAPREAPPRFAGPRDPERRLRIGYVSPDFKQHSCAYFLAPFLAAHDRSGFEMYAYSMVAKADAFTERFRAMTDRWCDAAEMEDDEFTARVRADAIDILVDCAGHTLGHRLACFARRLAPVQVTWLGYPGTTGLDTMDWRITDAVADPPGFDAHYSERLYRLDRPFLVFEPDPAARRMVAFPPRRSGGVGFGSFNNAAKINPEVARAWARILDAVPDSRLVLKARLATDVARQRVIALFAAAGVPASRLDLRAHLAGADAHLAAYGDVDVALDPFPYNGTTTTLEALGQGVPVVTLKGSRHAGRVGASLLTAVGMAELAADDVDGYVALAVALARDGERRRALRIALPERLAASPLHDGPGFARAMTAAFRDMWRRWCSTAA